MDRRGFLATTATATAAALGCSHETLITEEQLLNPDKLAWGKAPCRFCGTGCGVEVGVEDGKVVAVRGDKLAEVNKGLLCAKGYHLPGLLYGKDRLTHPLLRKADGSGFDKISWDEALDLIATKFKETLAEHGPEAVAMYGSGQWTIFDGYAALKWVKAGMRSNNLDPNARLCMASAVMGFMTQFQSDEPMGCYDDFEAADDFILWGNKQQHGGDAPCALQPHLGTQTQKPRRTNRRHRDSLYTDVSICRHLPRNQTGNGSGTGQRPAAFDYRERPSGSRLHRREPGLSTWQRERGRDRVRMFWRTGRTLHIQRHGCCQFFRRIENISEGLHA
ncbi:MAG: molybdopterin-dependent oxidoreductase [Planctomycetales bacterium]|nr:molybdopterin-dependent oxidoreductase [Planctomycetales bacterium]